jgi:hypothetical protein
LNKWVACLALSTSGFGASAYYFHGELAAARERHEAQSMPGMASIGATAPASSSPAKAIPTSLTTAIPNSGTPAATTGAATPTPSTADAARKVQAAVWSADMLKRLDDPVARAEMRALELARLTNELAGLDRVLELDAGQWAKLRELMVDYEMEKRAVNARCAVDPACVRPGPADLETLDTRRQAIRDFLGDENWQAMDQFRSLAQERAAVASLQSRLPANLALSAKQSDALAVAMNEERAEQTRELASRGQSVGMYGTGEMTVVYAKDAATPAQGLESAQQYAQRVRDRAAMVLNTGQLAVFHQLQDDMMISFRRFHRQQLARQTAPDKQP